MMGQYLKFRREELFLKALKLYLIPSIGYLAYDFYSSLKTSEFNNYVSLSFLAIIITLVIVDLRLANAITRVEVIRMKGIEPIRQNRERDGP